MDLLWTNPSPTSDFAPQTINLDLNDYIYVLIDFYQCQSYIYKTNIGTTSPYSSPIVNSTAEKSVYCGTRNISSISSTGIVFGNAWYYAVGSTGTIGNSILIPYKIYGIRGKING